MDIIYKGIKLVLENEDEECRYYVACKEDLGKVLEAVQYQPHVLLTGNYINFMFSILEERIHIDVSVPYASIDASLGSQEQSRMVNRALLESREPNYLL